MLFKNNIGIERLRGMLHIEKEDVRRHILEGEFGLEKESLRIKEDGTLSHTFHPFENDDHIVKDFCENQTEINTSVHSSVKEALDELNFHNQRIYAKLATLDEREYLWPFSNPPYIQNENDILPAVFDEKLNSKAAYREYLSAKYGRYKMTFSGIHFNFSFSNELLETNFKYQNEADFQEYKNQLYLELAKKLAAYGWLIVAITAASPVLDSSYMEKGVYDQDVFTGMGSVRCGEMGYWNEFVPILDYQNMETYTNSIQRYVDMGLLKAASELYYPIRLKPAGENSLDRLRNYGVNHIELRMFDLNPLCEDGIEEKDLIFAQLLMIWLASTPSQPFKEKDQIQAVQNFKNSARYDLKTVNILTPDGDIYPVADAALQVIDWMKEFYNENALDVEEILDFEYAKFVDANNRYAWKIRKEFEGGFVKKGLAFVKKRQAK